MGGRAPAHEARRKGHLESLSQPPTPGGRRQHHVPHPGSHLKRAGGKRKTKRGLGRQEPVFTHSSGFPTHCTHKNLLKNCIFGLFIKTHPRGPQLHRTQARPPRLLGSNGKGRAPANTTRARLPQCAAQERPPETRRRARGRTLPVGEGLGKRTWTPSRPSRGHQAAPVLSSSFRNNGEWPCSPIQDFPVPKLCTTLLHSQSSGFAKGHRAERKVKVGALMQQRAAERLSVGALWDHARGSGRSGWVGPSALHESPARINHKSEINHIPWKAVNTWPEDQPSAFGKKGRGIRRQEKNGAKELGDSPCSLREGTLRKASSVQG